MSDNTQSDMFEEMENMFLSEHDKLKRQKVFFFKEMLTWLNKQIEIIDNERAFFENLMKTAPIVDAAIYTLQMSNPPPLEEVMKVTGLGKTTIYNRLKTLRATEKVALDITFNPISDEAFNKAKDNVSAFKVLVDSKQVKMQRPVKRRFCTTDK